MKYVLLEEAPYADSERLDQPAHPRIIFFIFIM